MSLSASFTSEGVYVGAAVEYGIYAAIARMILIAAASDIAVRILFAQRLGLYLVTDISINASVRSWLASLRFSASWTRRFKVMALFATAFFVTRGLDLLASAYSAAVQPGRMQRLAFVRTANIAPDARPFVLSPSTMHTFNRSDVYHALLDIIKSNHATSRSNGQSAAASQWPEVIGALTEAEVAALVVDPNGMCLPSGARLAQQSIEAPPKAPFRKIAKASNISFDIEDFWHNNVPPVSLFGEHIETFSLRIESSPGSSMDEDNRSFQFTFPISTQFLATNQQHSANPVSPSSPGNDSDLTSRTRQHFGVMTNPEYNLIAYDMTCGLTPSDVDSWLKQRQPVPGANSPKPINPRNSSLLWYADHLRFMMNDHVQGMGLAVSAFLYLPLDPFLQRGEVDLLTFGSVIHGGVEHGTGGFAHTRGKVVPQVYNDMKGFASHLFSELNAIENRQSVLPLGPAPNRPLVTQAPCVQEEDSSSAAISEEAKLSSASRSKVQRCTIDLGRHARPPIGNGTAQAPNPRSMEYYHGPADRGAQICTVRARGMVCENTVFLSILSQVYSDLMVAARFPSPPAATANTTTAGSMAKLFGKPTSGTSAGTKLTTRCLPVSGQPPSFPIAAGSSNGRWGPISDPLLEAFGKTTADDPHGAQAWFIDVALLPWWELFVIAGVAILVSILGHWGDIAESLLVPLYAFAFRPTPPVLQEQHSTEFGGAGGTINPVRQQPLLTRTISAIDLIQPTQYVAVEYVRATPGLASSASVGFHGHSAPDPATDLHWQGQQSAVILDARLVPASWNVAPGMDLSPFLSDSQASKEHVVAAAGLLTDVVAVVRQRLGVQQKENHNPA